MRRLVHNSAFVSVLGIVIVSTCFASMFLSELCEAREILQSKRRLGKNTIARLVRIEQAKLSLAKEELTAIGTLVEEYSEQEGVYPGGGNGIDDPVERFKSVFEDSEIYLIPNLDPWGQSYRYWTDGSRYFVFTYGPDKRPSLDYSLLLEPEADWSDICTPRGDDMIFENGSLCRQVHRSTESDTAE